MRRHLRNSARLLHVAFVLARHGALLPLEALGAPRLLILFGRLVSPAQRDAHGVALRKALQALGPAFIKLGQALSTRSDLIGDAIATELAELQDNLPPFPATEVTRIIEAELGAPVDTLFAAFDATPVAAASIAQVHFARLENGDEVAVKILRPGIERAFARDIELFYWLAELAERSLPETRRLKPMEVVRTFEQAVRLELDLRFEASAAAELRENLKNDSEIYVPAIHWPLTSERVMVLERIHGLAIDDLPAIRNAGHNPARLVKQAATSFFRQVFRDGFFHADMHPGNVFVLADGRIAVVDFGIMGRVDRDSRIYLAEILRGFLQREYRHVAEMHIRAGYVPSHQPVEQFALACRAIAEPILGRPLNEISVARLLGQMFRIAETFEMETQPQLLMLQKTMMMAEGIGRTLDPSVNMWQMAEPLVMEWAQKNLTPQAKLRAGAEELCETAMRLPGILKRAEKALSELEEGGLRLHPDTAQQLRASRGGGRIQWTAIAGWVALALSVSLVFSVLVR